MKKHLAISHWISTKSLNMQKHSTTFSFFFFFSFFKPNCSSPWLLLTLKIEVSLQRTTLPIHNSVHIFILKLTMSCTWVHILSKILDFQHKSLQQDIRLFLILFFFFLFIVFLLLLLLFRFRFLLRSCRPAWALFSCITLALGTICCNILQEKRCSVAGSVAPKANQHRCNNSTLPCRADRTQRARESRVSTSGLSRSRPSCQEAARSRQV